MIGGAQAIREPWRNTYAHLVAAFGWEEFEERFGDLPLVSYLKSKPRASIDRMLEAGINVPVASSCGRLFDAVAAALGLCPDLALFEGQAAIELEDAIEAPEEGYRLRPARAAARCVESLLEDIRADVGVPKISARFHYGLAAAVTDLAVALAPGDTVALSGGCFQNKTLLEACTRMIETSGLRALSQADIATNDGGLSLGQAAIAAAREIEEDRTMCLGIPGQIVAITDPGRKLAMVDVSGVRREINVACVVEDDQPDRSLRRLLGAGPCRLRHEPHRRSGSRRDAEGPQRSRRGAAGARGHGRRTRMSGKTTLKSLYPFLHGNKQDPAQMNAALLAAVGEKVASPPRRHRRVLRQEQPGA